MLALELPCRKTNNGNEVSAEVKCPTDHPEHDMPCDAVLRPVGKYKLMPFHSFGFSDQGNNFLETETIPTTTAKKLHVS